MAERPYRRGDHRPPQRGTLRGIGVSPGTGAGPVRRLAGQVPEPPAGERHDGDSQAAIASATAALEGTAVDLEARGGRGTEAAEILGAQALMARDPEVAADVARRVRGGTSAARAVYEAFSAFREVLASVGGYLAGRTADLDDVRDRAVARLLGLPQPGVPQSTEPYVLVARDLAPADTATLDPAMVLAFATDEGGPTSHTAILARAIGVPTVVACPGASELADGTMVLVDGDTGTVTVEPAAEQIERARQDAVASAATPSAGPGGTADGYRVALLANVGGPGDIPGALDAGAEGIGLYRTEFLFLGRRTAPTEDEQATVYREALFAFPAPGAAGRAGGTSGAGVTGGTSTAGVTTASGAGVTGGASEVGGTTADGAGETEAGDSGAGHGGAGDGGAGHGGAGDGGAGHGGAGHGGAGDGGAGHGGAGDGGGGGPVVVRVLDAGADKPLGFLPAPDTEPNPALGERGLRLLRRYPDVLGTQLRALARAAADVARTGGQLWVMAPMVADADDASWFAARCRDAGITRPGIMIEIPGAALRAADLAPEVAFFSIGTNDLAQYAAAADREAAGLARLQDPFQPMLLDLIATAASAAAAAGKPCGVCGEAAADPTLACVLVGLGVTSLSMSPRALPRVRAVLASRTLAECQAAADKARHAVSGAAAREAARAVIGAGSPGR